MSTRLGGLRFNCGWTTGGLFKLYFVNSLGVIFTPAARAVGGRAHGALPAQANLASARRRNRRVPRGRAGQVGAIGDEASDLLGFDFGL